MKSIDIYIKFGYNVNVRLPEKAGSAYNIFGFLNGTTPNG